MHSIRELLRRKGREVHSIESSASVAEGTKRMTDHYVGSLVVLEGGRMVGIVTWHDIIKAVSAHPTRLDAVRVADIMTTELRTTPEDAELPSVQSTMVEDKIRHMPVMRGDEVVGIITLVDVLWAHLAGMQALNQQFEDYITGAYPG